MNRRLFISNLGAAVAAVMLPFGVKLKLQAPKKPKATMVEFWWQTQRRTVCTDAGYRNFLSELLEKKTLAINEMKENPDWIRISYHV